MSDAELKEPFWKPEQVAKVLNQSPRHVRNLIDRGQMGAVRCGHSLRIPKGELLKFLQKNALAVAA